MTFVRSYHFGQQEGEAKYGIKYRSVAWLVREHLYGAAQKECDHWHDDAGFANHHIGITMQFEQSMQSVDVTTAAHYWDYTIDAAIVSELSESIVFSDEWFGTIQPVDNEHTVEKGRWAYTPIMTNAQAWSNITNPYGLLRSPWNTDRTPFVTRSNYVLGEKNGGYSIPSCALFIRDLKGSDMGQFYSWVNGQLHGPIHIMVGGQWSANPDVLNDLETMDLSTPGILLASKFLWRQGIIRCPEYCGVDTTSEECACDINPLLRSIPAYDILNTSGLLSLSETFFASAVEDADFSYLKLLRILAHVGHAGEMFTSAAPYDPVFWPLHGMAERYLQLVRYYVDVGLLNISMAWSYEHGASASDTNVVCDWSNVSHFSLEMPTCKQGMTCPGHRISDVLPFEDILSNTDLHFYTNLEFFSMTGPFSAHLPYVYDQLTEWAECGNMYHSFLSGA